jgi:hypothetical protein
MCKEAHAAGKGGDTLKARTLTPHPFSINPAPCTLRPEP